MKNRALFIDDITIQSSYFGAIIRSPIAKGRLKDIELPSMPNFYTLITAETIPGVNQLEDFPVPIFASEILSYIGEPAAILLGPNEEKVREYAEQCKVIVEEEPPVFSAWTSDSVFGKRSISIKESKAPEPAEEAETNQETQEKDSDLPEEHSPAETKSLQGTYTTSIQEHWYADSHGASAVFSEGRMVVYTASQWPFHVKRSVSRVLGVSLETVLVEPSRIGIHLDGKIWYPSLVACHAALGAFIIKKPVKLIITREEDFRYSPKRNAGQIEIRSVLGNKGELAETEIKAVANLGAQGVFTDEILDQTCLGCLGAYRLGQVQLEAAAVKTNIPPQGPLSGFGLSQGFFALELHVSRLADMLHQDPAEWRKNHVRRKNESLPIGVALEEPPLEELIDGVAKTSGYYRKWASYELLRNKRRMSDWKEKDAPLRGIGIAVAYQGSGFLYTGGDQGVYTVEATLDKEGFLEIKSSLISANDTYIRIWREMAADILSIEGELVRIHLGNTDTAPDSGPGSSSRNLGAVTRLVENACRSIQKQRLQGTLPITVCQTCKPALKTPWEGTLSVPSDRLFDEIALSHLGWGTAVVEVEIDLVEYSPQIRGIWLVVDGGRLLSEERARLTLTQSAIHAVGWAAREQVYYINGKIPDAFFFNYDIPTPRDVPFIQVGFIRKDEAVSKGIGELPFSTIPAAYIQAVSQAMDHAFDGIPLNPQTIWKTGKLKRQEDLA
ncbi:MAG: molybdopterin-dependent oxidoreductase [Treponema sp.]|nr:molybdopterin-dependent oxidoreductase [Treponema sp.]